MKNYILIYNNSSEDKNKIENLLNFTKGIIKWRSDINGAYFIWSIMEANEIADIIISQIPNERFFISEINENRQGWLPNEAWAFTKGDI